MLNPDIRISRSMFACLKPFWVIRPRVHDRDTCLCKLHENSRLVHDKLKQLKALPACTLEDVLKHVVCSGDIKNRQCMTNDCKWCKGRRLPFLSDIPLCEGVVSWYQWQSVCETVDNKKVRKTVKRKVSGTVQDLKRSYAELIKCLKPHVYTIVNQHNVMSAKKEDLLQNEVLLHVDFSENWTVKTLTAVQSAHFGASLQQVTLHTGVTYFQNNQTMSFCTISDSTYHGPTAVWSHLLPVLIHIRQKYDHVNILHVVSDGPTPQYRNRYNFYLASAIPGILGFSKTWWNFSEAGHGNGPADGVGAAVKRLADRCVLADMDVSNANALYTALKPMTSIYLFLVDHFITLSNTQDIPPVPGTVQIHQVLAEPSGRILYRNWSCYCNKHTMCKCIKPKAINVGEVDKSGIHIPRECFSSEGEWAVEDVPLCETSDLFVQYFVLTDDGLLFPADIQAVNNLATDPAAVSSL